MERGSGFSRNIINELHSKDIQRDQTEGEGGATGSIIDELDSSVLVKGKVKVVVIKVSLMNFNLGLSK